MNIPELKCALFCAKEIELTSLALLLPSLSRKDAPDGTVYQIGTTKTDRDGNFHICCAVHRTNIGQIEAVNEVGAVIDDFSPHMAIFFGVAGGIRGKECANLMHGDIVVASQIAYYERGKVAHGVVRIKRGQTTNANRILIQAAEYEIRRGDWCKIVCSDCTSRSFSGLVISGEKVQKDTAAEIFQAISGEFPDAIAVEMEGYGFQRAAWAERFLA